ncbi:MAG: hypothetical protein JNL74_10500 [Fibrobacteres bacterium]|nr:hypothetical protein [Fibrobacterota bacterium]
MKYLFLLIVSVISVFSSEDNVWKRMTDTQLGNRTSTALFCHPEENRIVLTLGMKSSTDSGSYDEVGIRSGDKKWLNLFPDPALYTVWGDSFGNVRGNGNNTYAMFSTSYFNFKGITGAGKTFLRPYLGGMSRAHWLYAYNSDDKKVYYYVNDRTFTYNPATRVWDTLTVNVNPASYLGTKQRAVWGDLNACLKWGSLCYDPVNKEILLFGGGGVNAKSGNIGTWTFKPSTSTWTKLTMSIEPPPRAFSRMVYDPENQVIVLFGGDHLDYLTSDTWVYNCTNRTWTKKNPPVSPSPRAGHNLVYLPKAKAIVLIGGYKYTPSDGTASGAEQYAQITPLQMWKYNVTSDTWTLIKVFATTDSIPWFNKNYMLSTPSAVDTNDNIIALGRLTNSQYSYTPYTFELHCNPTVSDPSGQAQYGVAQGTVQRRSNTQDDPAFFAQDSTGIDTAANEATLRNVNSDAWVRINNSRAPVDRVWSTRIYNPDRDEVIVWGGGHSGYYGNTVPHYSISKNRWSIGYEAEWGLDHIYESGEGPGPHTFNDRPFMYGHPYDNYDYDVNLKKVVLIKFSYTYLYDPVKKDFDTIKINNASDMPGYYYHNSVTQTPKGCFAWSNTTPFGNTYQFWLMSKDSLKWRKLPINGGVTPPIYWCEDGGACYESKRDRMIFVSRRSDPGKIWTYDFATNTLTKLTPSGTGPVGTSDWVRELVYLPKYDAVLVQGGWLYDCALNEWRKLSIGNSSVTSTVSSGYFYDEKRDLVWDIEKNCEAYVLKLSSAATGIEAARETRKGKYAFVCSPNPFNPMTGVSFSLEEGSKVKLAVLDVKGRTVMTIKNSALQAGKYNFIWNGLGADGKPMASGIYIFRLELGDKSLQTSAVLSR